MYRCILVISLFLSATSFGQLHSVGFHVGAMGTGVGNTFWNGDNKPKIDLTLGLNYQCRFSSHLTLGGNLEYTQYGSMILYQYTDGAGNVIAEDYSSWDWNYISIPLIVGYEMGGRVSFKPKAALIPSVLNRAGFNFIPYEGSSLSPYKDSYYSEANKLDLAAMLGIDITSRFHGGVVFASMDFRYSMTKLNSEELFSTTVYDSYRNRGLVLALGVRFNLGNPEDDGPSDIIDDPLY